MPAVPPAVTTAYRFGCFELQPNRRLLLEDGRPGVLGHRALDVLLVLVERTGQLVPKDELLGRVWPGLVVEENNLQVQVSALRKILGPAAIATTAGRGYRFTLELVPAGASSSSPGAPRHNLPQQLTSFIGHEDDLDEYAALLDLTRLLTLTGIGGCGKTRLAIKLAERVLQSFPDGVWYVDMATLLDAERVPLTIATTLGIREENDMPIADTLCGRLASQRTLLVLDNCEHLVAACAALLQRVISAAPGVSVLAASREGLGVPGERAVTVRSLSFPPPGSKHELRALEACEAVRLFVERAQLAVPKFSLADDTADAVAEICRRLDGIPLAIELAAARVKMLSVEEIRARLDDRFRLLTGGSKTALARQQTLLATWLARRGLRPISVSGSAPRGSMGRAKRSRSKWVFTGSLLTGRSWRPSSGGRGRRLVPWRSPPPSPLAAHFHMTRRSRKHVRGWRSVLDRLSSRKYATTTRATRIKARQPGLPRSALGITI